MLSKITVSPSPHVSQSHSTRTVMLDVIIGLVPAIIASVIFFRMKAVIVIAGCLISCLVMEWICNRIRKKDNSLSDLSAVVTAVILALSLPPATPWWAAVIGGIVAIGIGKMVFGGLGSNVFNPAMVARAFLTLSFGAIMGTYTVPATIDPAMPAVSAANQYDQQDIQAVTQATPLGWAKEVIKGKAKIDTIGPMLKHSFWGQVGGCLGETSSFALLLGGLYLLIRRTITFHIPLAVLVFAAVFAEIAHLINPEAYVPMTAHLLGGGMLMCAFFIATDPVTAPLSTRGMWIFGAGVGLLIMLIRVVGEYPEGVMYAILIMNALTPLIDRFCKLIPAGGKPNV